MKTLGLHVPATLMLLAGIAIGAEESQSLDLRRGVPADAYLAIHGKHNPERDYQRAYYEEIWNTVEETRIIERTLKIVTDRLPESDVERAKSVFDELCTATEPLDLEALANAKEAVYAQFMVQGSAESKQPMTGQHLFLMRLTPEAAASTEEAVKNLFGLVEKYSEGKVAVQTVSRGDATVSTLMVPPRVPCRPTVARLGDIVLLSSLDDVAERSLAMLAGGEGESKFDDPRLKEALAQLPEAEDTVVFYDGQLQFSQLKGIAEFIRNIAPDEPDAQRVAGLIELLFDEISILDYAVTVEYTEGNRNRTATYGKLVPDVEDKLLAKMLGSGEPFEDWQTWIPSNALSYSLCTGVNLHPLYEGLVEVIEEQIPEATPVLEEFDRMQSEVDVYLDRDILQAFSGESVTFALRAANPLALTGQDSVTAFRCHKPDRIYELLHRLVDWLKENPIFASQQLALVKCENMDGFERLSALALAPFGVQPVIGFNDGWMIVGPNTQAVQAMLDARAGKSDSLISDTETFKQFNLEVEGPVYAIKHANTSETTRQIAKTLGQVGAMGPMIVGMVGEQGDPEAIKLLQEGLGLLSSVGQIVGKFDFLEAKLSLTQAGDEPDSYTQQTVTVIRPPKSQAE